MVYANDLSKSGWDNEFIYMYGSEIKANDYTNTERYLSSWGYFEYKITDWNQVETEECKNLFEFKNYVGEGDTPEQLAKNSQRYNCIKDGVTFDSRFKFNRTISDDLALLLS